MRKSNLFNGMLGALLLAAITATTWADKPFTEADRKHWSFQPIQSPEVPRTKGAEGVSNPIDSFLLDKLEKAGIQPSARAPKRILIRRATLDLTGLPPTPEEVRDFEEDDSPEAFEKVIDRLLLSPHYGERWARHWLDLARYAESEGFKADETRPNAWRYRDYVIESFNADKPYDRFVEEQIAGDELWPEEPAALVATGFNRHYPDESNARNLMQRRQEILNDITDTVGAVFAGLTFSCARCHDHKFDPILQKDYFRLQAFFANTAADDNIILIADTQARAHREKMTLWEAETKAIRERMAELEAPKRKELIDDYVEKYPDEIRTALSKPAAERTPFECQMVAKASLYLNPESHQYLASTGAVLGKLKGSEKKEWEALNADLKKFNHLLPEKLPIATGIRDISGEAPKTHLLKGGNYAEPRDEVQPGFLTLLNASAVKPVSFPGRATTGRRTALAKLLVSAENPLTSRVMVNRIWQYHFGNGLSGTASDFGLKGEAPTHPELLDYLAIEFRNRAWSVKAMHKLIMLSSAYQQSSLFNEAGAERDPANKLLWRFPRHRLEGEVIRDASLAVSGLLNKKMGGPSVFPPLPGGMENKGNWKSNTKAEDANRRSVYVFVRRNMRYPMFESFDMPDTHESCARRNVTTSPLQALTLLNNKVSLEWAQGFAGKVAAQAGSDATAQVESAYLLAYGRAPQAQERELGREFLKRQTSIVAERSDAHKLLLPAGSGEIADPAAGAALVDYCHMILNSNEFVYQN